jgi:small-conductance mechanosensitive channel
MDNRDDAMEKTMSCNAKLRRWGAVRFLHPWVWVGLLIAALFGSAAVRAADDTETPPPPPPPPSAATVSVSPMKAPVVVDGVELFQVRGIEAYPAARRAAEIEGRIETFAANPALSPKVLTVTEVPGGSQIGFGKQALLTVLDVDAELEQLNRQLLARVYITRISEAVEAYRRDRSTEYLLRSAGKALGATLALVFFLWLGKRAVRRIDSELDGRLKDQLSSLEIRFMRIVSASHVWNALRGLRKFLWSAATVVVAVFYLDYVLHLFPWTRRFASVLWSLLLNPLRSMGEHVLEAIPDLVFLVILVFVTRYILKSISLFFKALAEGTTPLVNFERDWAWPTYRLVRFFVIAFALVVAYPYIPGSQSDAFKGISLFLGVIVSLGSSSVIGNIIAGYTMIYRRAFRVGDRVKIEEHVGDITESRLLVTHLRTAKNEEIVIPNSVILNNSIVNYSTLARTGKLILHATVGIGYETPWRQVEAMLLQAADRTEGLLKEPKPFVLQKQLGSFDVSHEVNVYCDDAKAMNRLYTQLHRNILDVFNEYGVQIMTPAYESDPHDLKVVPRDQWYAAPAVAPDASPR